MADMRLLAALLCVAGTAAHAGPCMPHDDFTSGLKTRFGETAQVQAMSADGRMTEMFANMETGTWSVLMTTPDMLSCIVAAGDRFQQVKPGDPA